MKRNYSCRGSEEITGQMAIESPSFQPLVEESGEKQFCRILVGSFREDPGKKEAVCMCVCTCSMHIWNVCVSVCV